MYNSLFIISCDLNGRLEDCVELRYGPTKRADVRYYGTLRTSCTASEFGGSQSLPVVLPTAVLIFTKPHGFQSKKMLQSQQSTHASHEVARETSFACRLSQRRFHAIGHE